MIKKSIMVSQKLFLFLPRTVLNFFSLERSISPKVLTMQLFGKGKRNTCAT